MAHILAAAALAATFAALQSLPVLPGVVGAALVTIAIILLGE